MSVSDEMNERIRKVNQEPLGEPNRIPPFVPYRTMFKLRPPRPNVEQSPPRQLECVNCEHELTWRVYSVAPEAFDDRCPKCELTIDDFWVDTKTREVSDG